MSLLLQTLDQSAWTIDPRTYPGCALWLDANDLSTLYTDLAGTTPVDSNWNSGGGFFQSVRFWADKSSNSNHARSYETFGADGFSRYPITLGSPNVASGIYMGSYNPFTGATSKGGTFDLCGTLLPRSGSAVSIFVVADPPYRSLIPQRAHMIYSQGTLGTNQAIEVYFNYGSSKMNTVAGMYAGGGVTNTIDSSFYRVISIVNGGSSMSGWMDGSAFTTATAAVTTSTTGSRTKIGGRTGPDSAGLVLTGRIGEIIVYSNAVTTTQRQAIEGYLYNKWKKYYTNWSPDPVAGPFFPTTHPYFSRPPFSTQFDPRSIANCITWLDATDASFGFRASGSILNSISDKSGKNATVSIGGTVTWSSNGIGGFPGFDLNSGKVTVAFAAGNICTRYSNNVYAVVKWDTMPGDGNTFCSIGGSAAGSAVMYRPIDIAFGTLRTVCFFPSVYVAATSNANVGFPSVISSYNSGTSGGLTLIRLNGGVYQASASVTTNTASNGTHLFIGQNANNIGPNTFPGKFGELLVYNRPLNSIERDLVEGYLAWKWRIPITTDNFSPTSISGCALWLDGINSSSTNMTFSGANITVWKDKSGSGKDFTVSGTGCTYSTYPAGLLFTTNVYTSTYSAAPTTETLFFVYRCTNSTTPCAIGGSASGARELAFSNVSNFGIRKTGTTSWAVQPVLSNVFDIGISTVNGTTISFSRNGLTNSSTTLASGFSAANTQLGGSGATASNKYQGVMSEIIAYNRVLTSGELLQVLDYLRNKWRFLDICGNSSFAYNKVPPNLPL